VKIILCSHQFGLRVEIDKGPDPDAKASSKAYQRYDTVDTV